MGIKTKEQVFVIFTSRLVFLIFMLLITLGIMNINYVDNPMYIDATYYFQIDILIVNRDFQQEKNNVIN